MNRGQIIQWGGAAFMLGSLFFLVNKLNEMSLRFLGNPMPDVIAGEDIALIVIGQMALIAGFVAFFSVYASRAGTFGRITLAMFCGGGILLALGHVSFMPGTSEDLFVLVLVGVALSIIGLILFGAVALRGMVVSRWRWLPLATGLMGFIGFFVFSGEDVNATFLVFRTLYALGLMAMGLMLWLEKPSPEPVAATV